MVTKCPTGLMGFTHHIEGEWFLWLLLLLTMKENNMVSSRYVLLLVIYIYILDFGISVLNAKFLYLIQAEEIKFILEQQMVFFARTVGANQNR